jgi:outer membrane lipoprotein-sorting protein
MGRYILSFIGYIFLVFVLDVVGIEGEVRENSKTTVDGLKVMTMVSERNRGEDYLITTAWKYTEEGRVRHTMKYVERRKYYRDQDDIVYKSAVRYIAPPNIQNKSFLIWNYSNRVRALWYFVLGMPAAQRTTNLELIRSLAETDFNLADYYDINLGEEQYNLLNSEMCEDVTCYVVECTPTKKYLPYGKRIIWVDQKNLIPLKIEYFDKKKAPWKVLIINWQNRDGIWLWKKAVVANTQKNKKTFISIEDVKFNIGLKDREFSRGALQQQNF